jgi:hypothetical protein
MTDDARGMRAALRWLTTEYAAETPFLQHSIDEMADDGSPLMVGAAVPWLGLSGRDERPDDWRARACRTDPDGLYVTPMRCALARTSDEAERLFLVNLATNVLAPSDVCTLAGVPTWAASDATGGAIGRLRRRYRDRPLTRKWTELSEAQKRAEGDAA